MNISEHDVVCAIKKSWSKETAMNSNKWLKKNLSHNQCLTTALGAKNELWLSVCMKKVKVSNILWTRYHFFNKNNNNDVRFCDEQFTYTTIVETKETKKYDNKHIDIIFERYPKFKQQYGTLKQIFQTEINKILVS